MKVSGLLNVPTVTKKVIQAFWRWKGMQLEQQ